MVRARAVIFADPTILDAHQRPDSAFKPIEPPQLKAAKDLLARLCLLQTDQVEVYPTQSKKQITSILLRLFAEAKQFYSERSLGQAMHVGVVWLGDRLKADSLPESVKTHQVGRDGSSYLANFVLTAEKNPKPLNLVEYCTQIASVDNTFVTCIQASWFEQDWKSL